MLDCIFPLITCFNTAQKTKNKTRYFLLKQKGKKKKKTLMTDFAPSRAPIPPAPTSANTEPTDEEPLDVSTVMAGGIPKHGTQVQNQKIDKDFVEKIMRQLETQAGPRFGPYVAKASPFVIHAVNGVDAAYPYLVRVVDAGKQGWKFLEPFGPEQYWPLIFGLFMCFFGGAYMLLIAAIEALRMTVWDKLTQSFSVLYNNYSKASVASKKDDELDLNHDGIADVLQRTREENLSRKFYIFMRAVNPDQVMDALVMLWSAILTTIGTVRMKMAQCLTFGVALGETIYEPLQPTIEPALREALPTDLKHWAKRGAKMAFSFCGMMVAYVFQRLITAVHTSTRGAMLSVAAAIRICKKKGINCPFNEGEKTTVLVSWFLAFIGFYFQWTSNFAAPFPFNVVLLPFSIIENFLSVAIFLGFGM